MTREEIIELAREALKQEPREDWNSTAWVFADETLQAFAKLIAEKEREACELIEYDLAKSPAMFATMAEYKAYKDGVQDYRTKIIARGEA